MSIKKLFFILLIVVGITVPIFSSDIFVTREVCPQKATDPQFRFGADMIIVDGHLYIVNNRRSYVLSYRCGDTVEFEKQIGQKGQGPGDLYLPTEVSQWNAVLALNDEQGFSFFDKNGKFISKFRVFSPRISFVYVDDKIYFLSSRPKSPYLIECFGKNGKKLFEFGKKYLDIDFKKSKGQSRFHVETYLYDGKLLSDGKNIYYINSKFGQVLVFDLSGKLIRKKSIVEALGEAGREILKKNNDMLHNGLKEKPGGILPYYRMFRDIDLYNGKIYLMDKSISGEFVATKKEKVYIVALDCESLKPVKKYWFTIFPDEYTHSIAVTEKQGKSLFYITMTTAQEGGTEIVKLKEEKK